MKHEKKIFKYSRVEKTLNIIIKLLTRRLKTLDCMFLCLSQVLEAELLYRQSVSDAKIHQDDLVKVKERIISHIRKLICQGDTVLKEVGMKSSNLNICLPVPACV